MPEVWKPVAGHAGYEVSDRGRVRSVDRIIPRVIDGVQSDFRKRGRVLRPGRSTSGHLSVGLAEAGAIRGEVHRLVLIAFAGPPPKGCMARHLNGVPADNRWPENLEWASKSRNHLDRKWHDGVKGRLRARDVTDIKHVLRGPLKWGDKGRLAERYGITKTTLWRISSGLSHSDV